MKRAIFLLALWLGCGYARAEESYRYLENGIDQVVISVASHNSVIKVCAPEAGKFDDGSPRKKWDVRVQACHDGLEFIDPKRNNARIAYHSAIYLRDSCFGRMQLPHELAHRDGIAEPDKAGYRWGGFRYVVRGAAIQFDYSWGYIRAIEGIKASSIGWDPDGGVYVEIPDSCDGASELPGLLKEAFKKYGHPEIYQRKHHAI